ncbi:nucleotidyltransferase family protein [Alteraurantiacibacter aquimixticola]|uniref:Nucleotidyltransferase family protein n=1 Tax=Alteraurantiacibacter aquimixticola TaxID=2489173 RepID=A0A4T3F571_9SPHN|nr:nucleotidyltransferase family protein [Alteraurantiacibacter aquimixticola]TIX50658.1 nucleotidyltransferase family protein [Alteraurantiacibacter aquimixticola]
MAEGGLLVAVLAAGEAARFGGGKLDAAVAGKRLAQWVLDAVAGADLDPGIIVVGDKVPTFAAESGWELCVNAKAAEGLGTSLALAAREAQARGSALLVVLADMPLLDPDHLAELAEVDGLAATTWPGHRLGVPALFPADELHALIKLKGDQGAAALLAAREDVQAIPPPPLMCLDVDTPDDLARAEALLSRRG